MDLLHLSTMIYSSTIQRKTNGGRLLVQTVPYRVAVMLGVVAILGAFISLVVCNASREPQSHLLDISDLGLGEFSSPRQGTFHHYNDFWRLEPSTREWTRIESKAKGPSARSGHRMTCYKVSQR